MENRIELSPQQQYRYLIAAHAVKCALDQQREFLAQLAKELDIVPSEWMLDDRTLSLTRKATT
jgi:hypothetical protein